MLSWKPLIRHRRVIAASYLLLAGVAAPGLGRLTQDNSAEAFFVQDATALESYRRFEFDFGRDRALKVVLRGEDLWTREGLAWLERLEEEAGNLQGVLAAGGLYRYSRWRTPEWPPEDLQAFRAEITADSFARNAGWVGADGELVTVLVVLYRLSPTQLKEVRARLENLLAGAPAGIEAFLAGLPELQQALDGALIEVVVRILPLLVLGSAALLAAFFRRVTHVAAPLFLVGICETVTFGAMGYAGATLNMVGILLAPLLLVISLATAVHLLSRFRRLLADGLGVEGAVLETCRVKAWPVLWAGITTGIGFGSLAASPVPAVRSLGIWSAFGVAFMTLAALSFYPAMLAGMGRSASPSGDTLLERRARRASRALAAWAVRRRKTVALVFALVALAALAGTRRLQTEGNLLTYFRPDHSARARIEALEQGGVGAVTAELILEGGVPSYRDAAALERLWRLGRQLQAEPLILGTLSAGELVTAVAAHLPQDGEAGEAEPHRALEMIREVPELARMLTFLVSADGRQARMSLILPMRSFHQLEPLFARAVRAAQESFPGASARITGQFPLVLAAQRSLLETLVISLSVTLLCIAAIFRLLLRSGRLALAALLPNLWPVALVLGAMGWLGVPLDSTTVMIAAMVLGLVVDDTLHSLGEFRRLAPVLPPAEAAVGTLERTGDAHLFTSIILAAGFGSCTLSSFIPIARFGVLTAGAIAAALAADLLLVPALLARGAERGIGQPVATSTDQHEPP